MTDPWTNDFFDPQKRTVTLSACEKPRNLERNESNRKIRKNKITDPVISRNNVTKPTPWKILSAKEWQKEV